MCSREASGYFKGIAESSNPYIELMPRGFPRETRLMFIMFTIEKALVLVTNLFFFARMPFFKE